MLQRIRSLVFLIVLLHAFCLNDNRNVAAAAAAAAPLQGTTCQVLEECRPCSDGDKQEIEECKLTGKVMAYSCTKDDNDEKEDTSSSTLVYESCTRTKNEEEYLMIRLQAFCLLLGSFAFVNVRRFKVTTSSLFDRRKRNSELQSTRATNHANNNNNNNNNAMEHNNNNNNNEVEMMSVSSLSTFASRDEIVPLTSQQQALSSSLDIV